MFLTALKIHEVSADTGKICPVLLGLPAQCSGILSKAFGLTDDACVWKAEVYSAEQSCSEDWKQLVGLTWVGWVSEEDTNTSHGSRASDWGLL